MPHTTEELVANSPVVGDQQPLPALPLWLSRLLEQSGSPAALGVAAKELGEECQALLSTCPEGVNAGWLPAEARLFALRGVVGILCLLG